MADKSKVALITGATSGFGVVIAEYLAQSGYSLIILGRSKEKLDALVNDVKKSNPNCGLAQVICDLSSFKSTEEACAVVKEKYERIDLLILNAGLWNFEFKETEDSIEETLQVNLLAPVFMLEKLKASLPQNGDTKVIFTASALHQGTINFSDIEFRESFSGFKAYRQSKLGILLMTRLFSKLPEYSGISFYSVHPGLVSTKLGRDAGWFSRFIFKLFGKSKEKGAKTHLHLIQEPTKLLTSGAYYANSKVTKATENSNDIEMAEKLLNVIHDYFDRA